MQQTHNKSIREFVPAAQLILVLIFLISGTSGCSPVRLIQTTPSAQPRQETLAAPRESQDESAPLPKVLSPNDHFTTSGVHPDDSLGIFAEPDHNSEVLGELPAGSMPIQIRGEPVSEGNTNWIMVEYNQLQGWADQSQLAVYQGELPPELVLLGLDVLYSLKEFEYDVVGELTHPELCLQFSPYPFLANTNLSFCPDELPRVVESPMQLNWGRFDGTGDPIQMSFREYHQQFIFDRDYTQASIIGLNVEVSSGNSPNNIPDIFPDGKMIEYHFPGFDPQYGGMDWRSLRLVFVNDRGTWYLTAIVHCEWTI